LEEHFSRSARFCQDTPASTRAPCSIVRPRSHPRGHVLPRRRQPLYGNFMLSLATGIHKTSRNTKHKANSRDAGSKRNLVKMLFSSNMLQISTYVFRKHRSHKTTSISNYCKILLISQFIFNIQKKEAYIFLIFHHITILPFLRSKKVTTRVTFSIFSQRDFGFLNESPVDEKISD